MAKPNCGRTTIVKFGVLLTSTTLLSHFALVIDFARFAAVDQQITMNRPPVSLDLPLAIPDAVRHCVFPAVGYCDQ
jgi:hypothetical protein